MCLNCNRTFLSRNQTFNGLLKIIGIQNNICSYLEHTNTDLNLLTLYEKDLDLILEKSLIGLKIKWLHNRQGRY